MSEKDNSIETVSMLSITRAMLNNPLIAFGFITAFALGAAGILIASEFEGLLSVAGYAIAFFACFLSFPQFIKIVSSAVNGGEALSSIPNTGKEDFVAEAEIYLAYGKKKHAREALENALLANPGNELALKMLDEMKVGAQR